PRSRQQEADQENDMIRTISAELGLTMRCAVLMALTLTAFIVAKTASEPAFYGAAVVLAFIAGTTWDRQTVCDDCGEPQEER
ncbi:hypothetical protein, partial [Streptosporangium sp. NPDC048865]|uniref:hypothetical protein n=1 Tax=Streptosporangium sp. NPDC048865 TaxID=3155766 RepID=UPI0034180859